MNRNGLFGGVPIGSYFNEPQVQYFDMGGHAHPHGGIIDRRAARKALGNANLAAGKYDNIPSFVPSKHKDNDDKPKVDKDALASILSGGASSVSPVATPIYNPVMDDPYIVGDGEDFTPNYIKDQRPIIGQSYPTIISQGIGDVGEAIYADPINFGKDIASAAYQGGKDFLADPTGTIYNYGKGVIDSAKNIGTKSLSDYLPAGVDEFTATPEQMTEARQAKLSDYLNASALVPAAGVATAAAKTGGKLTVSAADNSRLAKSLRGGLGEEFYGLGGPDIPPNMGNFNSFSSNPNNPITAEKMQEYNNLKSLGLSDNEIQRRTGIKRYAASNRDGSYEVFGMTKPSTEIDPTEIRANFKKMQGMLGYYDNRDGEIYINEKIKDNRPLLLGNVKRHESEHSKQRNEGIGGLYGTGSPSSIFKRQEQILIDLNNNIRNTKAELKTEVKALRRGGVNSPLLKFSGMTPEKATEIHTKNLSKLEKKLRNLQNEKNSVSDVDASGAYFNQPTEIGARQASTKEFETYDPSITAIELLDPSINIGTPAGARLKQSISRAFLPTSKQLSKFREIGPRVPFGDGEKLLSGLAEALETVIGPLNRPKTPSTRLNKAVPYLNESGFGGGKTAYGSDFNASVERETPKDIEDIINSLKRESPLVEYKNQKAQMIEGGSSGSNLDFALNNLARRLGIERPD